MKQLLKDALTGELREYQSIPFWSWNNSLDEEVLVRQIDDMNDAGIGGFIMHARTGLKDEYLGEKWFSCISACLKRAKELNMEAWVYDENGWPSGFVGGKLLEVERFRARFLEYSVGQFDASAHAVYIADEKAGFIRVDEKQDGVEEYHNVYLRISPANSDILNPDVTEAFIQETHEKYFERYAESFGKELAGFFTDEPQYYRWGTPYTPVAEEYIENIRDGLIWLFVQDERGYAFRMKYFQTLNDLYVKNFYQKLYDWCESHNCKLTGHSVEEPALYTQMWGGAAVMPSYEYEHIPGIDCLARYPYSELAPKQVGSVAAQLGMKFILTETFGCSGNDVTPKELKSIAESQYFHGVNKMCQHLYPYSMAGRGKTDHPPVFGPHGNWGEGFLTFNTYFNRLSYVIANTSERVDIAILHPMRNVWLNYVRATDYESVKNLEESFKELLLELRKRGVTYHLLDEKILSKYGKIEGNCLRVGNCVYDTVLLPDMPTIATESYQLLQAFTGKLCALGTPSYLDGKRAELKIEGNLSFEELLDSAQISFACEDGNSVLCAREGEIGDFIFIKNISVSEESVVNLQNIAENYRLLDLSTLTEKNICNNIVIPAHESVILVKSDEAIPTQTTAYKQDVTSSFRVTDMTQNYLVLDYAQTRKHGEEFCEKYPISGLFERLLREDYKGEIVVRQTFTTTEKMPLTLIMERANLKWAKLNGKEISFTQGDYDVNFVEAKVEEELVVGENEFCYSFDFWQHEGVHFALFDPLATESLRNCLYYDTSIEPIYLKGDFVVNPDHSLSKRRELPPLCKTLYQKGYPFFKGVMSVEGKVDYDGEGKVTLAIDGRFLTAELLVNGKKTALVLDDKTEITSLLKKGENEIKILLRSSLRNLFGPFHFKPVPEPMGVSPYNFEFRGLWGNGKPNDYSDEYFSVPFGIERIYLNIE